MSEEGNKFRLDDGRLIILRLPVRIMICSMWVLLWRLIFGNPNCNARGWEFNDPLCIFRSEAWGEIIFRARQWNRWEAGRVKI